jgi:GNAT superfamily N-acetyltransferase
MKITQDWQSINFNKIVKLYDSVGWSTYTKSPELLEEAFKNSTFVLVAMIEDDVIGLSRSISDNVSIHYLQDILVCPEHQKKGVGRRLLSKALDHFHKVRTHMILTDDEESQLKFYESLGYKNTKLLKDIPLNTFVKMSGVELD